MNYFDHAASSPLYPEVIEDLKQTLFHDFANPGAKHLLGAELKEKIEEFRGHFLKSIKAPADDQFIFTSSATESNNMAIRGISFKEGDEIIYCSADHPSVTAPVQYLKTEKKIELRNISLLSNGHIDSDKFKELLSDKTKLVILTQINNQSGVINNVALLAKWVKEKSGAHVHVDAVQSFAKIDLPSCTSIDSMSLTSHKIGGPKGVAGLYIKKRHKLGPLILGGGQEGGLRSGTESYPLISAFYLAAKIGLQHKNSALQKIVHLNLKLKDGLKAIIGDIEFPFEDTSPYILTFIVPRISSDIILRHLEIKKIYVSSTSACSARINGLNPVLQALQIPEKKHKNVLRFSLSPLSTEENVDTLLQELQQIWKELCIHI